MIKKQQRRGAAIFAKDFSGLLIEKSAKITQRLLLYYIIYKVDFVARSVSFATGHRSKEINDLHIAYVSCKLECACRISFSYFHRHKAACRVRLEMAGVRR